MSRACAVCGRPTTAGNQRRCPQHQLPPRDRSRSYRQHAAELKATALACAICGGRETPDDPFVVDHRIPRSAGGTDDRSNLQVAHRSCNARKGAHVTNRGEGC